MNSQEGTCTIIQKGREALNIKIFQNNLPPEHESIMQQHKNESV